MHAVARATPETEPSVATGHWPPCGLYYRQVASSASIQMAMPCSVKLALISGHAHYRCNGCGKSRLHKPTRDEYGARVAQTYYRCERFAVCANCFDRMFRHHLADQPDAGVETIPASESVMEEKSSQVVAVASATPGVNDASMDEKT